MGDLMDLRDFAEKQYFYELGRKDTLTGAVTIPIAVLTVVAAVIGHFLESIRLRTTPDQIALILFTTFSVLSMLITIYYIIKSYYNHPYRYIPTTREALEYHLELKKYYAATHIDDNESEVDFQQWLAERYAISAHENSTRNDRRSYYLHIANGALIATIGLVLLSAAPYYWATANLSQPIYSVKIEEGVLPNRERSMHEDTPKPQSNPSPPSPTTNIPSAPAKPAPPPDRIIKEGGNPANIRRPDSPPIAKK